MTFSRQSFRFGQSARTQLYQYKALLIGRCVGARITIGLVVAFLTCPASYSFESDPATVDPSPALCVGETEISHYLVDKNYNLFVAGIQSARGRAPTADEVARWFTLFAAQISLKAKLEREGWLERPEISERVRQMSRYVLTKTDGPFYERLYKRQPIPVERVKDALAIATRSFDASIVRFDDDQAARRALASSGSVTGLCATAVVGRNSDPTMSIHDGWIHWPFHPFEEISEELAHATAGQTLGPLHRGLGTYYAVVHRVYAAESYGPASDAGMELALRVLDNDLARRRHRAEVLRTSRFSISLPAVETAATNLQFASVSSTTLPSDFSKSLGSTTLASYQVDGELVQIAPRDFAEYFNGRLFRYLPHTSAELISGLQDLVIEEVDARAARQLRLDRTPKFLEDQRNFALNQAIAAYEQEVLLPHLQATPDELHHYAATHADDYLTSVESSGTLFVFSNQADANRAAIRLQQTAAIPTIPSDARIEPFLVRGDTAQLVAGLPNSAILAAANGALFGPFQYKGKPAIFLKRSSSPPLAPSFASIAERVRRDFTRAQIDEAELVLFRNALGDSFRVHLDFTKYGLPASFSLNEIHPFPRDLRSAAGGSLSASVREQQ